jgi:hypothetical protein
MGAETSSLHVIQSFNAHSGEGPLLGTDVSDVSEEENVSFKMAGKSYQLFEVSVSVELTSVRFVISLSSSNCEIPTLRTHEPKQFFAVYKKRTKKGKNMAVSQFAIYGKTRVKAIRIVLTPSSTASNLRGALLTFQDVSAQIFAQSCVNPRPR